VKVSTLFTGAIAGVLTAALAVSSRDVAGPSIRPLPLRLLPRLQESALRPRTREVPELLAPRFLETSPTKRGWIDFAYRKGFLPAPEVPPLYQLSVRFRPWAGQYFWESFTFEAGAAGQSTLPSLSYKLGVSADVVELATQEPRAFQVHIGGGMTSLRPAFPVFPSVAAYIGFDARYELGERVSASAGIDFVPTGFSPIQLSATSLFVPSLSVTWRL
jgi:hypothetical protein